MTSIETAYTDYKNLLSSLNDNKVNSDTIYEKIMSLENDRISLINRVVNEKNKSGEDSFFFRKPIVEIFSNFANQWRMIFVELLSARNLDDFERVFYTGDRKIYTGLMLLLIAFFVYFVDISA